MREAFVFMGAVLGFLGFIRTFVLQHQITELRRALNRQPKDATEQGGQG